MYKDNYKLVFEGDYLNGEKMEKVKNIKTNIYLKENIWMEKNMAKEKNMIKIDL